MIQPSLFEAQAKDEPLTFSFAPTAYEEERLKRTNPKWRKQRQRTMAKAVARKWAFFCEMTRKWTTGHQLVYLRSIIQLCHEEELEVPAHVKLWARFLEIAESN